MRSSRPKISLSGRPVLLFNKHLLSLSGYIFSYPRSERMSAFTPQVMVSQHRERRTLCAIDNVDVERWVSLPNGVRAPKWQDPTLILDNVHKRELYRSDNCKAKRANLFWKPPCQQPATKRQWVRSAIVISATCQCAGRQANSTSFRGLKYSSFRRASENISVRWTTEQKLRQPLFPSNHRHAANKVVNTVFCNSENTILV